jgi:hypothetical protein
LRGDVSGLQYRIDIANNGFEWMAENVYKIDNNNFRHISVIKEIFSGTLYLTPKGVEPLPRAAP